MNMKKLLKSLLAIAAAFLMVFSLGTATTAVHADTSVTINDNSGNGSQTYSGWKLFSVTASKDANGTMHYSYTVNSQYTSVLTSTDVLSALNLRTGSTTDDVLEKLEEKSSTNDDDLIQAFAKEVYSQVSGKIAADVTFNVGEGQNVNDGYYLIAENESDKADPDTVSCLMLNTADATDGNLTITTKEQAPTVEKKVKETNDTTGDITGWQDAADYDIGDYIPFQITGTVSEKYDEYNHYYYQFTDTSETGITLVNETGHAVKVELDNNGNKTDVTNNFTTAISTDGHSMTITNSDLKNSDTGVSDVTGTSKFIVTYYGKLNDSAVKGETGNKNAVKLTYSNNPNSTATGEEIPKNDTPEDHVIVFTYQTIFNKVDQNNNALTGAKFSLWKKINGLTEDDGYKLIKSLDNGTDSKFTFTGLDAGEYKLVEDDAPRGYNKLTDPIKFTIVADYYANQTGTDQNAAPSFKTLTGADVNNSTGTVKLGTYTSDKSQGSITANVQNTSGNLLPTTGGIGTTMFYVVGGGLVAIAAVLLISKKRASAE
jgi:LPXTG-motif cell wall-anchored protein